MNFRNSVTFTGSLAPLSFGGLGGLRYRNFPVRVKDNLEPLR